MLQGLLDMLDDNNEVVKAFRNVRNRLNSSDVSGIKLRLLANRTNTDRVYIAPIANEIVGLIIGDFDQLSNQRDVIVEHRSEGFQRINSSHPLYMAMQYPLLFPFGEDGYRTDIKYRASGGRRKIRRNCMTMREYFAYMIQQRLNHRSTLLRGGRLFHQFLVDAFATVEGDRLEFIKSNQRQLRSELFQGVRDAVSRGDVSASSLGKRIILPASFTAGPRYMFQNYQDAMAICRYHGFPDLFITFTCNPKWLEIQEAVKLIPGQRAEDRPDLVCRVFRLKVRDLMNDLTKNQHFGKTIAGQYFFFNLGIVDFSIHFIKFFLF